MNIIGSITVQDGTYFDCRALLAEDDRASWHVATDVESQHDREGDHRATYTGRLYATVHRTASIGSMASETLDRMSS